MISQFLVAGWRVRVCRYPVVVSARLPKVTYRPVLSSLVRAEAQRLDRAHEVTGYGPHAHDFFEVVVFEGGGGEHVVSGEPVRVQAGQAWLLAPGAVHDLGALGRARGWVLVMDADVLDRPCPASGQSWPASVFQHSDERGHPVPLLLSDECLLRWVTWLEEIARERVTAATGYQHAVRALVDLLLVDAMRRIPASATPRTSPLTDKALAIVEARFQSRLSLSDVARELSVTPGHLTEVVRRQTGRPLGEWILGRRMTRARELLAETDQPVGMIAVGTGFTDAGTFSRQFRRRHGRGPSAWRAALRESGTFVSRQGGDQHR
jgi:AraC family transcriptional regulator, transcriptional activator of pobA